MNKRETWLDVVKIISTFLIIILHTVNFHIKRGDISVSNFIYYMGTFAIPMFFLINGYLNLREIKSYKYSLKKICNILKIVLGWNIIYMIFNFIFNHMYFNIFVNTLSDFLEIGFFWHFWFLGSLIIIYSLLPLLSIIFNRTNYYKVLTFILLIICLVVDLIDIFYLKEINISKIIPQVFRIWIWLLYYCIGGLIRKNDLLEKLSISKHLIIMIISIFITLILEMSLAKTLYGTLIAENFYSNISVVISVIIIFTFIKKVNFRYENYLSAFEKHTFGIYIVHIIFLEIFGRCIINSSDYVNFFVAIMVFEASYLIVYILLKIPLINKLIKF